MSNKVKNIVVAVMVIVITSLIVSVSYGAMSELGFATDNEINYNQTLKITYQNDNELDVTDDGNFVLFSVVNTGTLDMLYDVLVTLDNIDKDEVKRVYISIDGNEHRLSELDRKDDKYLLYTGAVKKENNSNDALSHKVIVSGKDVSGSIKISVSSKVVNDLASDVITSLNYDNNKFGLIEDIMGNIRYVGNNPYNYIKFNDELWRVIGVFNVSDGMDGTNSLRVKLVKDEVISTRNWSDKANLFNNSTISKYLNSEYYETIKDKKMINYAISYIGEYGSITSKEQILRLEDNGQEYSSVVSIPTIADYLYAKSWMSTGWLLGSNVNSTEMFYSVLDSGEVGLKKYNERAMVSPVVYLNSTIRIIDGDGSRTNPFVIQ